MALERSDLYPTACMELALRCQADATSRRVVMVSVEGFGCRAWLELPSVQILVVVANTQVRTLRTEVEKGSM